MPDVLCFDDLDLFGRECPTELDALEQDLYHAVLEAPGSNPDDLHRGLGMRQRLNGPVDPSLRARAEAQCRRDPRVDAVRGTVTQIGGTDGAPELRLSLEVESNGQLLGLGIDVGAAEARRSTG